MADKMADLEEYGRYANVLVAPLVAVVSGA